MLYKKSQLKMLETIAVLIVFFFLLGIGFIFYSNIEKKSMVETQEEFEQLKEIQIAQLISHMPELECPTTLETENCVDEYKLKVLKETSLDNYYYDFFGFSKISVQEIYPNYVMEEAAEVVYDNLKGESYSMINVPVSIYDPIKKQKKFGILNIKVSK